MWVVSRLSPLHSNTICLCPLPCRWREQQALGLFWEQPVKIVELGKFFPPYHFGGIEMVTELSALALAAHHDVTVICHNNKSESVEETRDGFRLIRCATEFSRCSQPVSLTMGRVLTRSRPDLIHFHAPNFWAALMVELYCPRVPVIVTHHADVQGRVILRNILRPLYHRIARRSRLVMASSERIVRYSTDLPKGLDRIMTLPSGVDETAFELDPSAKEQIEVEKRQMFGDHIVVGFSRLRPTKWKQNIRWVKSQLGGENEDVLPTRIAMFDLSRGRTCWEVDLEAAGMNAVFSIHSAAVAD